MLQLASGSLYEKLEGSKNNFKVMSNIKLNRPLFG
jgi:hypothetical protein